MDGETGVRERGNGANGKDGGNGGDGSYGGTGSRDYGAAAGMPAGEIGQIPGAATLNPSAATPPGSAAVNAFIGTIVSYDEAAGTALATLTGSPDRFVGPLAVTAGLPRDARVVGATCLVVEIDPYNPADGVVAALWGTGDGAGGPTLGAALTQAGRAAAAIPAGATGTAVTVVFARPYAVAPVVVASTDSPGWTAAVTATTPAGCTLSVSGGASGDGATVAVSWIAVG